MLIYIAGNVLFSVLRKVKIEPSVRVECVPKFFYPGDIYLVPAVWRKQLELMKCVWSKFKELSPILTAHCAMYHMISRERFVELVSRVF